MAGVVRKRTATDTVDNTNPQSNTAQVPDKKAKTTESEVSNGTSAISNKSAEKATTTNGSQSADLKEFDKGALKCIGILPGIGKYRESSDSEKSTDTDDDYDFSDFDWVGRKIKHNHEDCQ